MMRAIRKVFPSFKFIRDEKSARVWEFWTKVYEVQHLILLSNMTYSIAESLSERNFEEAAMDTVANIFLNIYPIMLQRYNRIKINEYIKNLHKAEAKQNTYK